MELKTIKKQYNLPVAVHLLGALGGIIPFIQFIGGAVVWLHCGDDEDELQLRQEVRKMVDLHFYATLARYSLIAPLFWQFDYGPMLTGLVGLTFFINIAASAWSLWQALRASRGEGTLDVLHCISPFRLLSRSASHTPSPLHVRGVEEA